MATKTSKPLASHPTYEEMIKEAIVLLKEKTGSSQSAIAKFIEEKHKQLPPSYASVSRKWRILPRGGANTNSGEACPRYVLIFTTIPFSFIAVLQFYQVDDCWRRKVEEIEGTARGGTRSAALEDKRLPASTIFRSLPNTSQRRFPLFN